MLDGAVRLRPDFNMHSPPAIVTFASPKGGVGKSTSCLSIASGLAARGENVLILDLDQTNTLIRWQVQHQPQVPNLRVETSTEANLFKDLTKLYHERSGFIFLDLAGALSRVLMHAAAIAHLTITPARLSEPDILEATKLRRQLALFAQENNRPLSHRLLVNEVAALLPTYQRHMLDQIAISPLQRFETLMHNRAPYAEAFLTGQPPHFADRNRPPVRKAIEEIDAVVDELVQVVFGHQVQAEAA